MFLHNLWNVTTWGSTRDVHLAKTTRDVHPAKTAGFAKTAEERDLFVGSTECFRSLFLLFCTNTSWHYQTCTSLNIIAVDLSQLQETNILRCHDCPESECNTRSDSGQSEQLCFSSCSKFVHRCMQFCECFQRQFMYFVVEIRTPHRLVRFAYACLTWLYSRNSS